MFGKLATADATRGAECGRASDARQALLARALMIAIACVSMANLAPAAIASTRAGTIISNTADVRYEQDGLARSLRTNTASFRVDELVSFSIDDTGSDTPGQARFRVTNTGNGCEAVSLAVSAGDEPVLVAIDRDDDGDFNPDNDAVYDPSNPPTLCPGESVQVFVVLTTRTTARSPDVIVLFSARGATSAGHAGSVVGGAGDGGGDVVVGDVAARSRRIVASPPPQPVRMELFKSQSVAGEPSASRVSEGDVILYTLRVAATGEGLVEEASLADPLPVGLAYVPGSLTLDGVPLSDAADADFGEAFTDNILVRLPPALAPFDRVVAFRARVIPH